VISSSVLHNLSPETIIVSGNKYTLKHPVFGEHYTVRGKLNELVGAAIFLASDALSFVNGQIIYVDSGFLSIYCVVALILDWR